MSDLLPFLQSQSHPVGPTLMLLRLTSVRLLSLLRILSRVSSTFVGLGGSSGKILNGSAFTTPEDTTKDAALKFILDITELSKCARRTVDALGVGDGSCGAQSVVVLLVAHQRVHSQDSCEQKTLTVMHRNISDVFPPQLKSSDKFTVSIATLVSKIFLIRTQLGIPSCHTRLLDEIKTLLSELI